MSYALPIADQHLALEAVSDASMSAIDPDITDAILEGAAAFAVGTFAPARRIAIVRAPSKWNCEIWECAPSLAA